MESPPSLFAGFLKRRTTAETIALGVALIVPIGFVLYSHEVWEDFLITYRHSENLIRGHGLVFTPGERVHGFTSPLNVLLPALFGWIAQAPDFAIPLFGFRLVSLFGLFFALVAAASVMADGLPNVGLRRLLATLFPIAAVLEIKTTAYAMNGQETGLMLGFLVPLFVIAYRGWAREQIVAGGICLAGLMYSRPDAFVHASAAIAAGFVFNAGSRRAYLAAVVRSAALGFLLYLPWLVFTQLYYGSFIPHTIVAKRGTEAFAHFDAGIFAPVAAALAKVPDRIQGVFGAIYDFGKGGPGGWPAWSRGLTFALELVAVLYCLVPSTDRLGRMASLAAALLLAYLSAASVLAFSCPWYQPPAAFLGLLALFRMIVTLPPRLGRTGGAIISVAMAAIVFGTLGFVFFYSALALQRKQEAADWNHRRVVGLWLKENVRDNETVFLEPLGYVGYFSQRKILDWPGLVSPEVVAARRKIGRPDYPWAPYYWGLVAAELKPDWIVARPLEVDQMKALPELRQNYGLVRVFNATDAIVGDGEFHGLSVCYQDLVFEIFRRVEAPAPVQKAM